MNKEIFTVDANTFITPYKTYYPFDFAPTFWDFLKTNIENGNIALLNKVFAEVQKGNDALSNWIQSLDATAIDHRQPLILANYSAVLTHIQTSSSTYNEKALAEWSDNNRGIVAAAMTLGHTVVTFEQPNRALGTSVTSHPKIPDVCSHFDVKCVSLYSMMRALGFSFK